MRALMRQVEQLQAVVSEAQDVDACAPRGCRLSTAAVVDQAWWHSGRGAGVAAWRDPKWDHPTVRGLRIRVSQQAAALDRLREENGLPRRWVSQRPDGAQRGLPAV